MPPARLPIQRWRLGRRELAAQRNPRWEEGNAGTPKHPTSCACSGRATANGSESLQVRRPLATQGETQENQGEERIVYPGGSEKHPHHRSQRTPATRTPLGRAHTAAHMRAHAPPQPPADTCRRPRSRIARFVVPSRFPARTMGSGSTLTRGAGLEAQRVTQGYLR